MWETAHNAQYMFLYRYHNKVSVCLYFVDLFGHLLPAWWTVRHIAPLFHGITP